jgi:hypothetical protein
MGANKPEIPTEFKRRDGSKIAIHHDGTRPLEEVLGVPLLNAIKLWTVSDDPDFVDDLKTYAGYDPEAAIR